MSMPRLLREFPLDFECPTPEELLPVSSNFESKKGVVAFCICYLIQIEWPLASEVKLATKFKILEEG